MQYIRAFWDPKTENFLSFKKNYLNTFRKHRTTAVLYLIKCYGSGHMR